MDSDEKYVRIETPMGSPQVDSSEQDGPKMCKICGDKALGYNFSIIACESCKAFFRRNALRKKPLECPFEGKCDINRVSRKFCQKCRLDKCFTLGMKKDGILPQDKLMEQRQKRAQKRTSETPQHVINGTPLNSISGNSPVLDYVSQAPQAAKIPHSITTIIKPTPVIPISGPYSSPVCSAGAPVLGFQPIYSEFVNTVESDGTNLTTEQGAHQETVGVPKEFLLKLMSRCMDLMGNGANVGGGMNALQQRQANMAHVMHPSQMVRGPGCSCKCTCGASKPNVYLQQPVAMVDKCQQIMESQHPMHDIVDVMLSASAGVSPGPPVSVASSGDGPSLPVPPEVPQPQQTQGLVPTSVQQQQSQQALSAHSDMHGDTAPAFPISFDADWSHVLDAAIDSAFDNGALLGFGSGQIAGFDDFEQARFDELILANEVMKEPLEWGCGGSGVCVGIGLSKESGGGAKPSLDQHDVINMVGVAIKRIIRMSKQLTGFRNLGQNDQIALLKGGCAEMLILRGVMTFESDKESWYASDGHYLKLDVLKEFKGRNLYEEHKRYLQSFKPEWRTNEPIMLLLGAITLFTAQRANVEDSRSINSEQEFYYRLLRKYLESMFMGLGPEDVYADLVQKNEELRKVAQVVSEVLTNMDSKKIEPLLIEIFDLK